jgi:hypothetical protein
MFQQLFLQLQQQQQQQLSMYQQQQFIPIQQHPSSSSQPPSLAFTIAAEATVHFYFGGQHRSILFFLEQKKIDSWVPCLKNNSSSLEIIFWQEENLKAEAAVFFLENRHFYGKCFC